MKLNNWLERYKGRIYDSDLARSAVADFKKALDQKKIVIYGIGIIGQKLSRLFSKLDLEQPLLIDRDFDRFSDYQVHPPTKLKELDLAQCIIIVAASAEVFAKIIDDISSLELNTDNVYQGHALFESLVTAVCTQAAGEGHVDLQLCSECIVHDSSCDALRMWGIKKFIKSTKGDLNQAASKLFTGFGYVLGQVCSLNCKHCNEGIPRFTNRKQVRAEVVLQDIKQIAKACQFINVLEFVGGEPFLHKELDKIVQETCEIENIGIVKIVSNATVVPKADMCEKLQLEKICVYVSNYQDQLNAAQKSNVLKTLEFLKQNKIRHAEGQADRWYDFTEFKLVSDDKKVLQRQYANCDMAPCYRLYDGRLYACPHHYAGVLLEELECGRDAIDIHEFSPEELAVKLDNLKRRVYLEACKYCTLPFNAKEVPAALQAPREAS